MSKPRIASFILSAIVGLALFVGLPTAASAQLTCGWCAEWYDANTREYSHQFASSTGGECLWPKPGASHRGHGNVLPLRGGFELPRYSETRNVPYPLRPSGRPCRSRR